MIDIVGWLMALAAVSTFIFNELLTVRIVAILAAVLAVIFYVAQPISLLQPILVQFVIIAINGYYLVKMFLNKGSSCSKE